MISSVELPNQVDYIIGSMPLALSTKGLLNLFVVMNDAYVNPVIAVILGRLVLGERITPFTLRGMGLILLGVSGVFWKRFGPGRRRG